MPDSRKVSVPIVLAVFCVAVTITLTVGWQILVAREFGALAQGFTAIHWVLAIVGSGLFALIITAAILLARWLVQEIRTNQRQQDFLDAVTHELHTPLASLRFYLDNAPSTRSWTPPARPRGASGPRSIWSPCCATVQKTPVTGTRSSGAHSSSRFPARPA